MATALVTDDTRYWPVEPGMMYVEEPRDRITRLRVDGYRGRALITPQAHSHLITLENGDGGVGYTEIIAHPDVVMSIAETMLAGAARKAGIEVKR